MPANGEYEKVKSIPSIMDDSYEYVLRYRSYWLSMSVVLTLKYILGWIIFVSGEN